MHRRYRLLLLLLVVLLAMACGSSGENSGAAGQSVTGKVIAIDPRSLTEFNSLTVIDSNGEEWQFVGGRFAGFTPSHLREHMALGDAVTVWYEVDGDDLRVTRIEDG